MLRRLAPLVVLVAGCAEEPGPGPVGAVDYKNFNAAHSLLAAAKEQVGIAYATASPAQTLDLFVPLNGKKPYPVVIRIHGGGFQSGAARMVEQGQAAEAIVGAGYALAAVNYRLSGEAPFPAGGRDVKAAVRFLRANAAAFDLDANRFAAWGEDAGGYFAVMLGVTGDQATIFDDPSLGNPQTSSAVQAVIDWYAPLNFGHLDVDQAGHPPRACIETYQRHNPAGSPEASWACGNTDTRLDDPSCADAIAKSNLFVYLATAKQVPPLAVAHGEDDCVVPWWQSAMLVDAAKKREFNATLYKTSRIGHADPAIEFAETGHALDLLAPVFRR